MQWIRQGTVSSLQPADMTVRVAFEGLDTPVSEELPLLIPPANMQMYYMPEVGDRVLCVFTGARGYCIGMLQTAIPTANEKDWGIWFTDEQFITFQNDTIHIQANKLICKGDITLDAPKVMITGNLHVGGTITGKGKLAGCCTCN